MYTPSTSHFRAPSGISVCSLGISTIIVGFTFTSQLLEVITIAIPRHSIDTREAGKISLAVQAATRRHCPQQPSECL